MLECHGLSVSYGQHRALENIDIHISPGEIVVILGANGAGKSTLLKAIAGVVPCGGTSQVLMDGLPMTNLPPHQIVEAGVALVPEERRLFGDLTVLENLLLGAYAHRARESEKLHLENVLELFPILQERKSQVVRTMSGGEQQMVAIGRAVMSAPSILMLDEPSLGLSPLLCRELFRTLTEVGKTGVGILLVEQNAHQGLSIADRGYLLENGHIVGEDAAHRLAEDSSVQAAYLGGGAAPQPGGEPESASPGASAESSPAAIQTAAPDLPRFEMQRKTRPAMNIRADDLIPGSLAEMVNKAAEVQAEHTREMRGGNMESPKLGMDGGGDPLQEALARIEQAAADARTPRSGTRTGARGTGAGK